MKGFLNVERQSARTPTHSFRNWFANWDPSYITRVAASEGKEFNLRHCLHQKTGHRSTSNFNWSESFPLLSLSFLPALCFNVFLQTSHRIIHQFHFLGIPSMEFWFEWVNLLPYSGMNFAFIIYLRAEPKRWIVQVSGHWLFTSATTYVGSERLLLFRFRKLLLYLFE